MRLFPKRILLKTSMSLFLFYFTLSGINAQIRLSNKQNITAMPTIEINSSGELEIKPSETSSKNDFDFFAGKWNVHNKKLKSRLSNSNEWIEFDATQEMRKVLTSIGNVDNMYATIDGKPYEGMTVRLFNPATRLWSIYWADNNLGVMDKPVVGSFDRNTGTFFCKETFKDKEIIVKFHWDISNPDKPVWSQAFSPDNGKTWEWNWYMFFTRKENNTDQTLNENQPVKVIELRNYVIKPAQRDRFVDYFEENFIQSQNILGGYVLGQFRVKGADDNFFWIRGFHDMASRNKALNDFYYGPVWKEHKNVPNSMLANNDNVHLLKPLYNIDNARDSLTGFNSNWFGKPKGIAVVDFYIANQKLDKLIDFFSSKYIPLLKSSGVEDISFWISELMPNDFTPLPVFQDKNLLVSISFYKDELDYQSKIKQVEANMSEEYKNEMLDMVTIRNSLIIYPTEKSFSVKENK